MMTPNPMTPVKRTKSLQTLSRPEPQLRRPLPPGCNALVPPGSTIRSDGCSNADAPIRSSHFDVHKVTFAMVCHHISVACIERRCVPTDIAHRDASQSRVRHRILEWHKSLQNGRVQRRIHLPNALDSPKHHSRTGMAMLMGIPHVCAILHIYTCFHRDLLHTWNLSEPKSNT